MPTSVKEMLLEAAATVPELSADQVRARLTEPGALLLDVRDPPEIAASGKIAGAVVVSRGFLEFRADPASPSHHPALRPDAPVLVYCASGGRAALAGRTLQALGYSKVANAGGFKALVEAGLPVERT